MEPSYVLWSIRGQGWLTATGNATSDIANAQQFPKSKALARVRASKDFDGRPGLLPISTDDLA